MKVSAKRSNDKSNEGLVVFVVVAQDLTIMSRTLLEYGRDGEHGTPFIHSTGGNRPTHHIRKIS